MNEMPTVSVTIPQTTFISSAQPNNNYSFYPLMYTGEDLDFQSCISLMQIDLSSVPVTQVDSAMLQLSVIAKTGTAPSPIVVNRVTEAFDTATVTYTSRPSYMATASQINVTAADLYTTVDIDVTALVNGWLNGTMPNDGIALTNSDGVTLVYFATNAIVYPPYFPKLSVTYSNVPSSGNSALCFCYAQLANVIKQLFTQLRTDTFNIYTNGFNASSISGTPFELYASPDATYGTLAVLGDLANQAAVPLTSMTVISLPAGTAYPSIQYLPVPTFPAGCDKNLVTAYHDYLPVGTNVTLYLGSIVSASGMIFRNEYGLLVLADDLSGTSAAFIPIFNITAISITAPTFDLMKKSPLPLIISGSESAALSAQKVPSRVVVSVRNPATAPIPKSDEEVKSE